MSNKAVDGIMAPQASLESRDDVVRFNAVTKHFGEIIALREVSLAIKRGEFMTLLGPSGCGKTTLLNLIAGFFSPDSGEILIDGERVNDVPTYKREIGMMFQNYALFPHMTVGDNIAYGLKARHVPKKEIDRRVGDVLTLVKLNGLENRKPRQLSGGQQQRVALARALVIKPKVLLLDEPFSALDKNLRASMQVELREIQRELGVTTVFVTHDQSEALSLSDRLAVMSEGHIRQLGSPQEIYRAPCERFVASFVGDANILRGRLDRFSGGDAVITLGVVQILIPSASLLGVAAPAAIDLFVRPEQLQMIDPSHPCASMGTVVGQVYQGGHTDLYIECKESPDNRLLVRLAGHEAMTSYPIGAQVGISVKAGQGVAFPIGSGNIGSANFD